MGIGFKPIVYSDLKHSNPFGTLEASLECAEPNCSLVLGQSCSLT
jgi:hypothetical protein